MSRKDFELIASVIRALVISDSDKAHIASAFARALATTNERFDSERFVLAALGSSPEWEAFQNAH